MEKKECGGWKGKEGKERQAFLQELTSVRRHQLAFWPKLGVILIAGRLVLK